MFLVQDLSLYIALGFSQMKELLFMFHCVFSFRITATLLNNK